MKRFKIIIIFTLLFCTLSYSRVVTSREAINNINYETINLVNLNLNKNELNKKLTALADDSNVIALNSRISKGEIAWYCIGSACDLQVNEYYSTINNSQAKKVLPVKLKDDINIYNFDSIDNINVKNLTISVIGDSQDIKLFKERLNDTNIEYTSNATQEYFTHGNSNIYSLIIMSSLMLIISLLALAKKYIIDKYNGLLLIEAYQRIILSSGTIIISSFILVLLIEYLLINNDPFFINMITIYLTVGFVVGCIILITELILCTIIRRLEHFKKMANNVGKWSKILLLMSLFGISIYIQRDATAIGADFETILELNSASIPNKFNEDYYTYGLAMYGDVDLNYISDVIDPLHVEFYSKTEALYQGILASFQNNTFDYPVVNENYLKYMNIDTTEIDSTKINFLTTDDNLNSGVNTNDIHVLSDDYKYIDADKGTIQTYSGPIYVINESVIKDIDPTLISLLMQSNTYYLNLDDDDDLDNVEKLLKELGLEQNVTDFYHPQDISSNLYVYLKSEFRSGFIILFTLIIIWFVDVLIYMYYTLELKRRKLSILVISGESKLRLILKECIIIWAMMFLPLLIQYSIYSLTLVLFSTGIVTLIEFIQINKIKKNIASVMAE